MANWKKVLVSGSAIDGNLLNITGGVTMSHTFPVSTDSADLVLVQAANGQLETRAQSSIAGITTAVFEITGSDNTKDSFNAASDGLVFKDTGDITTNVVANGTDTELKLTIKDSLGLVSGSGQIATQISGAFALASQSFVSQISAATASINTNISDIADINTSITALNAATASYALSASIIGTANEVEVTANGAGGVQIGIPTNPTFTGTTAISGALEVSQSITADTLILTGISLIDNNAAVISGSNIFGNELTNTHQFTGSIFVSGSTLQISDLGSSNSVGILDLVATDTNGNLVNVGTAVQTQISNSFVLPSASIATDINALQVGFLLSASNSSTTIPGLNGTASFAASGNGLSVGEDAGTITYTLNVGDILSGTGVVSSSAQIDGLGFLQVTGDNVLSSSAQIANQISGSWQGQNFVSQSQIFAAFSGSGIVSGAAEGTNQGQIKINGVDINVHDMGTNDSPQFTNLTITNDLIVQGNTTTINTTNLNIEDQFILLNSGALAGAGGAGTQDKDGGLIFDFGGGSGSAFLYDGVANAFGVKGFSGIQTDFLAYNSVSDTDNPKKPEHIVSVVSSSALNPSAAPTYGNSSQNTDKGAMHINTNTGDIWIYS